MSKPSKPVYSKLYGPPKGAPVADKGSDIQIEQKKEEVKRVLTTATMTTLGLFTTKAGFQTLIQWLFFLSLGALVLFVLLVILYYAGVPIFSFSSDQTGMISMPTAENSQTSNVSSPALYSSTYNFTNLSSTNVTYGLDVNVASDFTTTVPRVLWYRAKGYVTIPTDAKVSDLPKLFPQSNVVFYLDPLKNDLMVFLQGVNGTTKMDTCIENVPIGKVFRINFVIMKKYVEVYLAGKLVKTVSLNDDLLQTPIEATVFGPPQRITSIRVANVRYWSYLLSPKIISIDGLKTSDQAIFS